MVRIMRGQASPYAMMLLDTFVSGEQILSLQKKKP